MATFKLTYQLSEGEYTDAWRVFLLSHFLQPRSLVLFGLALAFVGVQWRQQPATSFTYLLTAAMVGVLVYRLYAYFRLPKLRYRRLSGMREPLKVELSEEGVRFKTSQGEKLKAWATFTSYRETEGLWMLHQPGNTYLTLPKRVVGEAGQVQAMNELLASQLPRVPSR